MEMTQNTETDIQVTGVDAVRWTDLVQQYVCVHSGDTAVSATRELQQRFDKEQNA